MSSPNNYSTDVTQNLVIGAVVDVVNENKEAEIIEKCKDLFTKTESGFAGITKEIIKHLGKEFADSTLKSLLECAICKEIIVGTVSRKCMHSFCHHCLTNWLKRSANCPICRDKGRLTVKNPLIDQFIDLLVDLTFTEEEKSERSNSIQQRSIPSSDVTEEHAAFILSAVLDPSLDTSLVSRCICMYNNHSLLYNIFNSDQFKQLKADKDYCDDVKFSTMKGLCVSFSDDFNSLKSVFDTFPRSMVARYFTYPFPS